jgi:digeranylgeranylglycerophospholipid reductase
MKYDVAVVGAGPGGLFAALTAARQGLSVALIEKREDISTITRACCEQFIMDKNYSGDTLSIADGTVTFTKNKFTVPYDGPLKPVTDKYYISPHGRTIHFAYEDKSPIVLKFDKGRLLQGLLKKCEQAGVKLHMGSVVYGAEDTGEGVTLALTRNGRHTRLSCRKLLAADGCNTAVGEALGINRERTCFATALCIVYYMRGIEVYDPTAMKTFFGRRYKGLAPIMIGPSIEDESVGYVICTGNKAYPPPQIFRNVTTEGALAPAFKNAQLVKQVGCSIKTYSPLRVPWRGNSLLVGDAAAYVEVETQGALMCGYHAANAVVKELKGESGFDEYTRWWQSSFEFLGGDFMRVAQGFVLVPTYEDEELDYLFGLVEGERLEGTYNQYKSPRVMWDAILAHNEQIQFERPEIFEKITTSNVSLSDML